MQQTKWREQANAVTTINSMNLLFEPKYGNTKGSQLQKEEERMDKFFCFFPPNN